MTDVIAKLNACIINARMQQILEKNGMEEQSGSTKGRGCPDANFTVKQALHTRQMYGQPTWAAFVDLEKAYDTVDRDTLFQILKNTVHPQN